ncbi:hypothetical protein FA15DRAFT_694149 [Coprinopsis marcescibilis]|uniref:Pali-domain-containing protein n=1 Tax=Coprinopsis marcescibilis TaxID=230819 RepID=A0A5C3KWN3_COPMA|nr:hypothetical protein FA15DRAFT_694149 [Coprinopsis marcescibilis]
MAKLWIPSNIALGIALILSLLVAISLPALPALDISRITSTKAPADRDTAAKAYHFGVWNACVWDFNDVKLCGISGAGYEFPIVKDVARLEFVMVTSAWTRGLAIHPVVTACVAIALGASVSSRNSANLLAPLISLGAAVLTTIAFAIDIAFHLRIRHIVRSSLDITNRNVDVSAGPGFWLTLVVLILCAFSGGVLIIARRREVSGGSAYPALSSQFQTGIFSRLFKK